MKAIRINFLFEIERKHWLLAANSGITKKTEAVKYIRDQVELFGTEDGTLLGDNFCNDLDEHEETYGALVDKWTSDK